MVLRRQHALHIQLAETWTQDQSQTLLTLELLDDGGSALALDISTLPHQVDIATSQGRFTLCFVDIETLMLTLPAQRSAIRLRVQPGSTQPDRRGGMIQVADERPLTVTYTTNAVIRQHDVNETSEACQVVLALEGETSSVCTLNITRTVTRNRYLPSPKAVIESARRRWQAWFDAAPSVPEADRAQYYFAWWVLGINLIRLYAHPQHEGMIPSKRGYVGVWNWDAYFHAIALRHSNIALARDQFRILVSHQLANGMIPDVIQDHAVISHTTDYGIDADITKPPLTAWAIWKLYEIDGDKAFLDEMYDPLVRSQRWWFAEHDTDQNGLCEYLHPYSSGLDNNPLFDDGVPLEAPDLNAYLILQYDTLAKIAAKLGHDDESRNWTHLAEVLMQRLIDQRWDADAGYFWAWRRGKKVTIRTPFNLLPLLTGRLPHSIAQQLVTHLTDPEQFWTRYPVPTVARNDPKHDPQVMWRGPVWINVNYLLIEGLQRSGFAAEARELRRKTLDMIRSQPDIYEYYHPQTGEKPPKAVSVFGWSSALFIDLLLAENASDRTMP